MTTHQLLRNQRFATPPLASRRLACGRDGHVAEWLRSGLQIRVPEFDSRRGLHFLSLEDPFMNIPAGFEPFSRKSPVTEPWEPIFAKRTPEAVVLAVRLAKAHTNSRGFAHGGFISALADQAMGSSLVLTSLDTEKQSAITVSLSVDFIGSAKIGQWVEFTTTFIKAGSTLCFTQCFVSADHIPVARANATFRVVELTA